MQVHTTRSYAFSLAISPSKYLRKQPCHGLLSHHRQPIVLADGQVTRWSPMGEEAHGVAFLLGGIVYQSPLLQGLIEMGRVKRISYPARIVFLFLND